MGWRLINLEMAMKYVKGYAVLALYILITKATGFSFWRADELGRAAWLICALLILLVVFWPVTRQRSRPLRG